MKRAKWSEYADMSEGYLNSSEKLGITYEEMIEKYNEAISKMETLLGDKASMLDSLYSNSIEHLKECYTGLVDITEGYKENLEAQIDFRQQLLDYAKMGGISGFSALSQIEATKNIALAAVFLAISSIGFSVSSIIISIVSNLWIF